MGNFSYLICEIVILSIVTLQEEKVEVEAMIRMSDIILLSTTERMSTANC